MITIKGRFLTYGEMWFDEEPPANAAVDVLMYRLRPTPIEGSACSPFLSLVNDLTVDEAAIMAAFHNTNRYQINRAESRDALTFELIREAHEVLDEFCAFFDVFAQQKGIEKSYRRGLESAAHAGELVLSAARHKEERVVWHAHIVCRSTAALFHSASHFRGKDSPDRAVIGRANRWLHWREMIAFKQMGLTSYDWGGMFEDETKPEQASINSFKRQFGGTPIHAWNCVVPLTMKGHLYMVTRGMRAWLERKCERRTVRTARPAAR